VWKCLSKAVGQTSKTIFGESKKRAGFKRWKVKKAKGHKNSPKIDLGFSY